MMNTPATILAACLMMASHTYKVPPAVMVGIMQVEGGRVGQEVGPNINGSYDLGPMQINTRWLPDLARYWNVDTGTARRWIRDNGCVNMHVAAWILRQQLEMTNGQLYGAIARYHSATPSLGGPYAERVITAMNRRGLIDYGGMPAGGSGLAGPLAVPAKPAANPKGIAKKHDASTKLAER